MKQLLFACVFMLSALVVMGQQDPLHSNYRFNYFVLNPAAAGAGGQWAVQGSYLSSWTRFPGAPITYTLSASGALGQEGRSGIGINFVNDYIGPQRLYGAQFAYAYHLPVGASNLSFGLAARMSKYELDLNYVRTNQAPDPAVISKDENIADFSFGMMFYSRKGFIGVSLPQIAQVSGDEALALKMHLYLSGGYKFNINNTVLLEPMALIKFLSADETIMQYDINLRAHLINQQLLFGVGYRGGNNSNFLAVMGGFNVKDKYQFSYSYDFSLGDFQQYSWGSHEVTVGVKFGKRKHTHLAEHKTPGKMADAEEGDEEEAEEDEE